jgi:nucleotide-binding universal stress UspA family protein
MKRQSYNTILVPHDSSELADSVLPEVLSIVSAFSPKVILVQVVDSLFQINAKLAPTNSFSSGYVISELAEEVQTAEHQAANKNLEHLKKRLHDFGISNIKIHILEGYPGDEIVKLAKKTQTDLIIMSTHGRSGLGRVLMGSVADQVIHQSHCPVLVVRPKKNRS